MLKKFTNKKGFTLMEMLIVVAIIAVLVAIAIPTFAAALDKAKAATDLANIRSGYANAQVIAITEAEAGDYYLNADGTVEKTAAKAYVTAGNSDKAPKDSTIGGKFNVNPTTGTADVSWAAGKKIKYTVAEFPAKSGVFTVTTITAVD